HRGVAHRVPVLALNENFSAARVDWRERGHRLSEHRFFTNLYRQILRSYSLAYNKCEEKRRHDRCRNNVSERQAKQRVVSVKQHQRTDQKHPEWRPLPCCGSLAG